jgi:hypothetical protein
LKLEQWLEERYSKSRIKIHKRRERCIEGLNSIYPAEQEENQAPIRLIKEKLTSSSSRRYSS